MDIKNENKEGEGIRVKSPKNLGIYMHAIRPSVWIVLAAITIVLIGFIYWAVTGSIELSYVTMAYTDNGTTMCWMDYHQASDIKPGAKVICSNTTGTVVKIRDEADDIKDVLNVVGSLYIKDIQVKSDTNYYRVYLDLDKTLPDGVNSVKIITDVVKPGEFFLNLRGD